MDGGHPARLCARGRELCKRRDGPGVGADRAVASGRGGRTAADDLPAAGLNALFYLLQTGCQWRMLPRDFPPHSTVYGYFRAWIVAGVWAHLHDVLYRRPRELEGRDESPTAVIIDSQSVKTGAEAHEMVGFDAGKRIKGRKRHLVTDTLGLMLRVEIHSAGIQDRDGAALVFDRITRRFPFLERFFPDAGYPGPRRRARRHNRAGPLPNRHDQANGPTDRTLPRLLSQTLRACLRRPLTAA